MRSLLRALLVLLAAVLSAATGRPPRLARFGVGETYDFTWTPAGPMDAVLAIAVEGLTRRLPVQVR
jgi:hypothetical protein